MRALGRQHALEQRAGPGQGEEVDHAGAAALVRLPRVDLLENLRVVAMRFETQRPDLARKLVGFAFELRDPARPGPPAGHAVFLESGRYVENGRDAPGVHVASERTLIFDQVIELPEGELAGAEELVH